MSVAYLNFHAAITPVTAQHLMATFGQLLLEEHDEIHLLLSTPGGEVASGLTIYNFLSALPCKVVTHNIGNVDFIGNAVFLAGKHRRACKHSTFMFHGVGYNVANQRFEEKNLRESLTSILADQKRIGAIIASHTSVSPDQAGELFREASTKDADEALHMGIIHEVCDLSIPLGSRLLTLVLN